MPYERQTLDIQNRKKQPNQSTRAQPQEEFHAPRIEAIRRAVRHGDSVTLSINHQRLVHWMFVDGRKQISLIISIWCRENGQLVDASGLNFEPR